MLFKRKKEQVEVKKKNSFIGYVYATVGCFLTAFAFNVFFSPYNLVTGGVSGVSIITKNVFGISPSTFIAITYVVLLILSYIFLGKKMTSNSVYGSIVYPIFVYLTEDIANLIEFDVSNILLVAIFGAVINGIGAGIVFKYGFSTGGSDIICQIVSKVFKITLGDAVRIVNITIIISSGFFIGSLGQLYAWENVMYALICIYIISWLNDKVLLGISGSKAFYVITEHETDIKHFLIDQLGRGVTILEGRGGYTGDRKKVIMCAIPTKQYYFAKNGILKIDKDAVILINDVYQSTGLE